MALSPVTITGYFTEYDKWNRLKLMFLDEYEDICDDNPRGKNTNIKDTCIIFTKKYMMDKHNNIYGKSPISNDGKYMTINCPKNIAGAASVDKKTNMISIIPIVKLLQHKVKCVVSVRKYSFKRDNQNISGWNINLLEISLAEL